MCAFSVSRVRTLKNVRVTRRLNLALEQFLDRLCYPHEILLMLIYRHDFYPFDQIFYRHVFVAYFHPQLVVVDPAKENCFHFIIIEHLS